MSGRRQETHGSSQGRTLSVCCMSSGRRPALLAGIVGALRRVAEEIVVAVEEPRAEEVYAAVAAIADTVIAFPRAAPADRAIAFALDACAGTWIFNVDDDEVPSPALLDTLPALVRREDITHAWVARRWLYPTPDTFIGAPPWGTEFQLRLVLADERFLQFSDVFHRPLISHGPRTYVEAPLWHLDAVLNPAAWRRRKARAYEDERPGMRLEGLSHNLGMYVPELHPAPDLRPVPSEDRDAISMALAAPAARLGPARAPLRRASARDVDATWPGPPFPESLYRGTISTDDAPRAMTAGVQHRVDVEVTNGSDVTWRWGADARPEIRVGYRWRRDGEIVSEPWALRTVLPADLPSGATALVQVHVVAPERPDVYELELDLVHDGVRWFERGVTLPVEVRRRACVAVIAPPALLPELVADLSPEVEPVVLLRDEADRAAYGDYRCVTGLRPWLLRHTERTGRAGILPRLIWRTARAVSPSRARGRPHLAFEPLLRVRATSDVLRVGGANWPEDAAFTREWWALAATALMWRRAGRGVEVPETALPADAGIRGAAVRWTLRRLRTSS
jgi:hypothetical protein